MALLGALECRHRTVKVRGDRHAASQNKALTASTALTSALLRDIHDFKHCEISPSSEDTPAQIRLRSTQEVMLYAIKNSSGEGQNVDTP